MLRTLAGCKFDDCIFLSRKKRKAHKLLQACVLFVNSFEKYHKIVSFSTKMSVLRITPPPGAGLLAVGVAWLLRSQRDKHSGDSLFVHLKYLVDT